jgi:hypothetical protein
MHKSHATSGDYYSPQNRKYEVEELKGVNINGYILRNLKTDNHDVKVYIRVLSGAA